MEQNIGLDREYYGNDLVDGLSSLGPLIRQILCKDGKFSELDYPGVTNDHAYICASKFMPDSRDEFIEAIIQEITCSFLELPLNSIFSDRMDVLRSFDLKTECIHAHNKSASNALRPRLDKAAQKEFNNNAILWINEVVKNQAFGFEWCKVDAKWKKHFSKNAIFTSKKMYANIVIILVFEMQRGEDFDFNCYVQQEDKGRHLLNIPSLFSIRSSQVDSSSYENFKSWILRLLLLVNTFVENAAPFFKNAIF